MFDGTPGDSDAALCHSFRYVCAIVISGIDRFLVRPGHREDVADLVHATRDIVKERLKNEAWMLWAMTQREGLPVKIDVSVT